MIPEYYLVVAETAFAWSTQRRPLTVSMLSQLQHRLMDGTSHAGPRSGRIRDIQVVIGRRADAAPDELPIKAAQFVPSPPEPPWGSKEYNRRFAAPGVLDVLLGSGR